MHKRKFKAAALLLALSLILPAGAALAVSGAPVAENLNLTTYRNVCVGGQLAAVEDVYKRQEYATSRATMPTRRKLAGTPCRRSS